MSIISLVSTINDKKIPDVSKDVYFKSVLTSNVVIKPQMFLMGFDNAILKSMDGIQTFAPLNAKIKYLTYLIQKLQKVFLVIILIYLSCCIIITYIYYSLVDT